MGYNYRSILEIFLNIDRLDFIPHALSILSNEDKKNWLSDLCVFPMKNRYESLIHSLIVNDGVCVLNRIKMEPETHICSGIYFELGDVLIPEPGTFKCSNDYGDWINSINTTNSKCLDEISKYIKDDIIISHSSLHLISNQLWKYVNTPASKSKLLMKRLEDLETYIIRTYSNV